MTVGSVLWHLEMVCLKLHGALEGAISAMRTPVRLTEPGDESASAVDAVHIAETSANATTTSRPLEMTKGLFISSPHRTLN